MENLDLAVLRTLRDWRVQGQRAMLATVVRTWGSSPRPAGSIMALTAQGAVAGSVSGGCIEDDLLHHFVRVCREHSLPLAAPPRRVSYGVSAEEAHRFGLPCGGTMELVVEHDPDAASLTDLVRQLEAGHLVQRRLQLRDGSVELARAASPQELQLGDDFLATTFGPEFRMLLIGAGQLSECLAAIALRSGFAVTVCDPRSEYHAGWNLAGVKVVTDMPDDVVLALRPDPRTCVVALTHDPKLDDLALLEALESEAFYVGAIGSRRNNEARRQRLREHFGQTDASLRRLRGPIGIFIGSKTPSEIAVSVMAEILAVKNGVALPAGAQVAVAKRFLEPQEASSCVPESL